MKKRRYRLLTAAVLAAAVLIAGAVIFGPLRGWFRGGNASRADVSQVSGDVSVLRNGMAYVLKKGVSLRAGDVLAAGPGSECQARFAFGADAALGEGGRMELTALSQESAEIAVAEGAALFESEDASQAVLKMTADGCAVEAEAGFVLSVEAYNGTVTVSVFRGTPMLRYTGKVYDLLPGDRVVMIRDVDAGTDSLSFHRALAADLRGFLIRRLMDRGGLIFDNSQLQAVLDRRREETEQTAVTQEGEGMTCTLEIRCDTVLDHLDELLPETAALVPEDGVILHPTAVSFVDGDSVYDVLRRTCLSSDIEIEYSYAVALSGYYVKQIGDLAERACGPESGWMYKVNGWLPNFGSARYAVSDGDVIVWCYTCVGLGEDIGAEPWQDAPESEP